MPKSRTEFWAEKFAKTIERDQQKQRQLEEIGWKVLTVWECELKSEPLKQLKIVENQLLEGYRREIL